MIRSKLYILRSVMKQVLPIPKELADVLYMEY